MSFFPSTFFPTHEENKMMSEGDVASARENFLKFRPSNLSFLLKQRFEWMNAFLNNKEKIIELGSGPGFSKEFIANPYFKTSDVVKRPWIDIEVDALNLPFESETIDALVCSHMIHHLASPKLFFKKANLVLRPGGVIVISEIYTSWVMRLLLWLMKHEGWSYDKNVFDENAISNDPKDPWSANCAIPEMLFKDKNKFEREVPGFKIIHSELTECLIFPLSGGVIAKSKTILLPFWILKIINQVDHLLIRLFPQVFAMGIRVVLQKV